MEKEKEKEGRRRNHEDKRRKRYWVYWKLDKFVRMFDLADKGRGTVLMMEEEGLCKESGGSGEENEEMKRGMYQGFNRKSKVEKKREKKWKKLVEEGDEEKIRGEVNKDWWRGMGNEVERRRRKGGMRMKKEKKRKQEEKEKEEKKMKVRKEEEREEKVQIEDDEKRRKMSKEEGQVDSKGDLGQQEEIVMGSRSRVEGKQTGGRSLDDVGR